MTEKELHKLSRQDLLQLLVAQGRESASLQVQLNETEQELAQTKDNNDRLRGKLDEKDVQIDGLKAKLDDKDAQIERLKLKLDDKDALIEKLKTRLDHKDDRIKDLENTLEDWLTSRRIELTEAGNIAEAALRLNGIFDVAQQAAEQYLENLKMIAEHKDHPEPSISEKEAEFRLIKAREDDDDKAFEEEYHAVVDNTDELEGLSDKANDEMPENKTEE